MSDKDQDTNPEEEAPPESKEEAFEEGPVIPEEDFREAIAACRKDPQLNRMFEMAPPGAKLFLGLSFYSTHFAGKVDPRQYAECQAEIEPTLTTGDLKYLIRFERDKATKQYLRELLAQRKSAADAQAEADAKVEADAEAETAKAEETVAEEPPPKPSKGLFSPLRQKPRTTPQAEHAPPAEHAFPQVWNKSQAASAKSRRGISIKFDIDFVGLFKFAAQIAILLGGAFALYVAIRPSAPQPEEPQQAEATPVAPVQKDEPPPAVAERPAEPPKQAPNSEQASGAGQTLALIDAKEDDARRHGANLPVAMEAAKEPPAPAETNAPAAAIVAASEKRASRKSRVVFTDGKKIVRRPGGQIEVPRVFSCAGAGVRPFWVYDKHPESDAAREKKARDEWQALARQASQAEEEAARNGVPAGASANML